MKSRHRTTMPRPHQSSFEVRVPASAANLGAGFDCLGLALELYLTVHTKALTQPGARTIIRSRGVHGSSLLPSAPDQNLILRAMSHVAQREGFELPQVHLDVKNEIPIAAGLGSSAAAIAAGVALSFALSGRKLALDTALRYAAELESHADNVAAAFLGGLVVTLIRADGSVAAIRKRWPRNLRVIAVTPVLRLETAASRSALPKTIPHADAVHNLQRSALMVAALEERRYDLLWDAMQDRLHQPYRQVLIPGLAEVLAMPRIPGLAGVALSGSGPTVIALATDRFQEIGKAIADCFKMRGYASAIRKLSVAQKGLIVTTKRPPRR
jgi:homoserine kinase